MGNSFSDSCRPKRVNHNSSTDTSCVPDDADTHTSCNSDFMNDTDIIFNNAEIYINNSLKFAMQDLYEFICQLPFGNTLVTFDGKDKPESDFELDKIFIKDLNIDIDTAISKVQDEINNKLKTFNKQIKITKINNDTYLSLCVNITKDMTGMLKFLAGRIEGIEVVGNHLIVLEGLKTNDVDIDTVAKELKFNVEYFRHEKYFTILYKK